MRERIDVLLRRKTARHRDVPDAAVRPAVVCGPGPWIPGPLMHGDEMDVGVALHERLRAVAVVNIPVHDEHAVQLVTALRITRRDRDISEQAESHGTIGEGMMSRRSHGAECSPRL